MEVYVQVNTMSNFKNCNFKYLKVREFSNRVVVCDVPYHGFNQQGVPEGELVPIDFSLSEVVSIKSIKQNEDKEDNR
jgi:hypothetical protein